VENYYSVFCSYGCETWSLEFREEHSLMLREFGNRVVRKMFGPGREEITGG